MQLFFGRAKIFSDPRDAGSSTVPEDQVFYVEINRIGLGRGALFLEARIFESHSKKTAALYAICHEGLIKGVFRAKLAFSAFTLLEIQA